MAIERPADSGGMPPEIRQQAEDLRHLTGQDLGVLGAGYGVLPEGGNGLIMLVEEGMPDELKDILATAVPGGVVSFKEIAEPELYSEGAPEGESAFDRFRREVEAEADADPTGEARRSLDETRAHYRSEAERILARRRATDQAAVRENEANSN